MPHPATGTHASASWRHRDSPAPIPEAKVAPRQPDSAPIPEAKMASRQTSAPAITEATEWRA
ncbi:MAG: hypothetical protein SO127_07920 [Muribaculaceae bacterium]|nr:hypothetical protein [Muribaculaceae bacterium]